MAAAPAVQPLPPFAARRGDRCAAADPESTCAALAASGAPLRRAQARLAGRLVATRAWEALGFARLADYARERLGVSAREVQDLARVDAALARLPAIEAAFVAGRLGWTKARLLCRVATPADEALWLAGAAAMSAAALAREVRAVDAACGAATADDDEERRGARLRRGPRPARAGGALGRRAAPRAARGGRVAARLAVRRVGGGRGALGAAAGGGSGSRRAAAAGDGDARGDGSRLRRAGPRAGGRPLARRPRARARGRRPARARRAPAPRAGARAHLAGAPRPVAGARGLGAALPRRRLPQPRAPGRASGSACAPRSAWALLRLERACVVAPALAAAWRAGELLGVAGAAAGARWCVLEHAGPWLPRLARARTAGDACAGSRTTWRSRSSPGDLDPAHLPALPPGLQIGARPRACAANVSIRIGGPATRSGSSARRWRRCSGGSSAPRAARRARRRPWRRCSTTLEAEWAGRGARSPREHRGLRARRLALHGAGLLVVPEPARAPRGVPLGRRRRRAREPDDALRLASPARRARGDRALTGRAPGGAALRAAAGGVHLGGRAGGAVSSNSHTIGSKRPKGISPRRSSAWPGRATSSANGTGSPTRRQRIGKSMPMR